MRTDKYLRIDGVTELNPVHEETQLAYIGSITLSGGSGLRNNAKPKFAGEDLVEIKHRFRKIGRCSYCTGIGD